MKVGRVFLSGCAVYIIVAACSAMDPGKPPGGSGGEASISAPGAGGQGVAGGNVGGAGGRGTGGLGGRAEGGAGGRGGGVGGMGGIMDPVPPASADPTSGTRLKAKYVVGSDGSKSFLDGLWYDTVLGDDCVAADLADGTRRCVPMGRTASGGNLYSGPDCATPIANTWSRCSASRGAPTVALTITPDSVPACGLVRYTLNRIGPPATDAYQIGTDGSCTRYPFAAQYDLYFVGAEMPPSDFVQLTTHAEP